MFNEYTQFKNLKYHIISKTGHFNWRNHGGVALLMHESVPHKVITINTAIQAVAI